MARRKRAAARPRKAARTRVRKEASVPPEDHEEASATPPHPVDTVASTVDPASAPADGVAALSGSTETPSVIPQTSPATDTSGEFVGSEIVAIRIDTLIHFRRRFHFFSCCNSHCRRRRLRCHRR